MRVLIIGSGETTARLAMVLAQHGHSIEAQMARFAPNMLDMFNVEGIVVVGPEAQVTTEALQQTLERGRHVFIIAGGDSPLTAWAQATQTPTFAFPPNEIEVNNLLQAMRQAHAGMTDQAGAYRRAALGSDVAARLQSGMAIRKVVVTSPKGGTGKTTVAINLALALALSGVNTYFVDADANGGAAHFHLRIRQFKSTLPISLRRFEPEAENGTFGSAAVTGGRFLQSFTPVPDLPTLHFLPGFITLKDMTDPVLQDEKRLREFFRLLNEAVLAQHGVVIADVGINPAHPVHRAAMANAEAIIIVAKPEIPDVAQTHQWFKQMINTLIEYQRVSLEQALAYIAAHAKLVYNQVYGGFWKEVHQVFSQTLREEYAGLSIAPQGLIPWVEPEHVTLAVNSDNPKDILVWRYQLRHIPELSSFAQAIVDLGAHFIPTLPEAAAKVGIIPTEVKPQKRLRLFRR